MNTGGRTQIYVFKDLAGNTVQSGDRVAVAVSSKFYDGLRLGVVLKITGIWVGGLETGRWDQIRIKVKVDTSTNSHYGNRLPFIKTYDVAKRVIRLNG